MNWSNTVKKSGPKSLHNDVRDWQSHTGNHYFKLFLLKAVLQAAESRGVLLFRLCKRAVFIKFSIVCKIFVCCLCAQSAVMLQPHADIALWGDSSGSDWCVPVQSGDHLPLSHRFHSAGVYAVRLQVTHHSFPLRCRLSLYRCHRLHLHLGSEAYIELSRFMSHFSFFLFFFSQLTKLSDSGICRCLRGSACTSWRTSWCSHWYRWGRTPCCLVNINVMIKSLI